MDGSEDYERTWLDYKNGFGNLTSEFWLGKTCGNVAVLIKQVNFLSVCVVQRYNVEILCDYLLEKVL